MCSGLNTLPRCGLPLRPVLMVYLRQEPSRLGARRICHLAKQIAGIHEVEVRCGYTRTEPPHLCIHDYEGDVSMLSQSLLEMIRGNFPHLYTTTPVWDD